MKLTQSIKGILSSESNKNNKKIKDLRILSPKANEIKVNLGVSKSTRPVDIIASPRSLYKKNKDKKVVETKTPSSKLTDINVNYSI